MNNFDNFFSFLIDELTFCNDLILYNNYKKSFNQNSKKFNNLNEILISNKNFKEEIKQDIKNTQEFCSEMQMTEQMTYEFLHSNFIVLIDAIAKTKNISSGTFLSSLRKSVNEKK